MQTPPLTPPRPTQPKPSPPNQATINPTPSPPPPTPHHKRTSPGIAPFQSPATPSAATTALVTPHALVCMASAACSRTLTNSVGLETAAASPPLRVPASSLVAGEGPLAAVLLLLVGLLLLLLGGLMLGVLLGLLLLVGLLLLSELLLGLLLLPLEVFGLLLLAVVVVDPLLLPPPRCCSPSSQSRVGE